MSEQENVRANQSYKLAVFISFIMAALAGNEIVASNRFIENNFSQLVDHNGQKLGIDGFRIGSKRILREEN